MNIFSAIILGIIQGLTEFLPISSSGHLVLAQSLIPGFSQPGIFFDVILHAGTLVAVTAYFWKKILKINQTQVILVIIGTIPAVVLGLLFNDLFEASFSNVKAVGIQLIITGILCWLIDRAKTIKKSITVFDSLLIGIGQAIAIIPGISRSGSTIFAAVARGINRAEAAEFSFFLSIPAIAGAIVLQTLKHGGSSQIDPVFYFVGFITSLVFGFLSIKVLLNMLKSKQLKYFGIYCLILGVIAVLV